MSRPFWNVPLDALPTAAAILDVRGRIISGNEALGRRLGLPSSDLAGRQLLAALAGGPDEPWQERLIIEAISRWEPTDNVEIRPAEASLAGTRPARVSIRPFRRGSGRYALAVVSDRRAGVSRGDEDAEGTPLVASDVRHTINNALTGILGNLQMLEEREELGESARARIRAAAGEAERLRLAALKLAST